jgi:ribonuclease-3
VPNKRIDTLKKQLGYEFSDPALLQRALTHRSYSTAHYERLEFLGDSVLGCIIARHLFATYPQLSEGDLSRVRSNLVKEDTLMRLAQQLDLGNHLYLGEGERKSGGHNRPSILADAMEALIGAVLLDGGFEAAEEFVLSRYIPYLKQVDLLTLGKDPKTLLQEYLQARRTPLPLYTVCEVKGEAHAQAFHVECSIPSLSILARGEGSSRRSAEQQAAQLAYAQLIGADA